MPNILTEAQIALAREMHAIHEALASGFELPPLPEPAKADAPIPLSDTDPQFHRTLGLPATESVPDDEPAATSAL